MYKIAGMIAVWFAALTLANCSKAGEPGSDIPHEMPVSATEIVVCGPDGGQQILTMILTYGDGKVVRFKTDDMHGFTVPQLMAYASQAKDTYTIATKCGLAT